VKHEDVIDGDELLRDGVGLVSGCTVVLDDDPDLPAMNAALRVGLDIDELRRVEGVGAEGGQRPRQRREQPMTISLSVTPGSAARAAGAATSVPSSMVANSARGAIVGILSSLLTCVVGFLWAS